MIDQFITNFGVKSIIIIIIISWNKIQVVIVVFYVLRASGGSVL